MAIGLGKMMGFRFPENFNDPYTSRSVTEFWKRWHMTLGNFIMNYLYIPLGGNRKGKGRMYFNLWLCFLLSGLWHGASWNFVLWGAFHGFFICADKLFLKDLLKKAGKWPSVILTFFVVNMGWVLFRVDTAADAGSFYQALFAFRSGLTIPSDRLFWFTFALAIVFSFLTLFKRGQGLQDKIFTDHYSKRLSWTMFALCLVLFILSAGSLCVSDFNPFIYFRF
jgi:alginate O-acetyltransferase complex protein AlgI